MSNNGAALLGGLLIGGLVVGAAMSENERHKHHHHHHHRPQYAQQRNACTYCICGAKMVQGNIQQGVAKCNNLNCQKVLTGSICYYCPNGGNVQQHKSGFFYCQQCAFKVSRNRAQVIQAKPAVVQAQNGYPAQQRTTQKAVVVKQGYMSKKGNWLNTGYKKRWFKLWSNKKMAYLTHPGASYTKGYADFTKIKTMEKKGKHGFEVNTEEREWAFLCQSTADRDAWFFTIQSTCTNIRPQVIQQPQYVPQQPVQYVPKQQVQYVPKPQVQYASPAQPQANTVAYAPSQPGMIMNNNNNNNVTKELQPGMMGYNVGDMYGNNNNNNNNKIWSESKAPPPAFSTGIAPSAPPEDDLVPSAPPAYENEGAYTGQ